jgi:hypothetical protein
MVYDTDESNWEVIEEVFGKENREDGFELTLGASCGCTGARSPNQDVSETS